jgi:CubicO group peptidase (beta-lactamase class C family)
MAGHVLEALNALQPMGAGMGAVNTSLAQRMNDLATPGASISLIENFEIAFARGFGIRAANSNLNVTRNTIFQAGSVSKLVFAIAIARLSQDGALDLDEDINKYLLSWRVPAIDGWSPRITLRHLLTHTAGTTVHGFPGYPSTGPCPTVMEVLNGVPPANNQPVLVSRLPGLQFQYSGGGTVIAQQALEDHMGMPFAALMQRLVFGPLGMTCSTYEQHLPADLEANAAGAHPWNGLPIPGHGHIYPEMAAAGLWTTAEDLAKLAVDFMRSYHGRDSVLGLSQDGATGMLCPPPGQRDYQQYVGLGWFCDHHGGAFRCGHRGENRGFITELTLFPALGKGAVVMLNSNQGAPLRHEVLNALGGAHDWPDESRPGVSRHVISSNCSGCYRDPEGRILEIEQVGDRIELQFERQPPLSFSLRSDGKFWTNSLQTKLDFRLGVSGEVTHASFIQDSTTFVFEKEASRLNWPSRMADTSQVSSVS